MNEIHKAFKVNQVALRYYNIMHPSRKYEPNQALRQFRQDLSINWNIVEKVIDTICQEQKKLF